MIAKAGIALEFGATSKDIAHTCHAHPTHDGSGQANPHEICTWCKLVCVPMQMGLHELFLGLQHWPFVNSWKPFPNTQEPEHLVPGISCWKEQVACCLNHCWECCCWDHWQKKFESWGVNPWIKQWHAYPTTHPHGGAHESMKPVHYCQWCSAQPLHMDQDEEGQIWWWERWPTKPEATDCRSDCGRHSVPLPPVQRLDEQKWGVGFHNCESLIGGHSQMLPAIGSILQLSSNGRGEVHTSRMWSEEIWKKTEQWTQRQNSCEFHSWKWFLMWHILSFEISLQQNQRKLFLFCTTNPFLVAQMSTVVLCPCSGPSKSQDVLPYSSMWPMMFVMELCVQRDHSSILHPVSPESMLSSMWPCIAWVGEVTEHFADGWHVPSRDCRNSTSPLQEQGQWHHVVECGSWWFCCIWLSWHAQQGPCAKVFFPILTNYHHDQQSHQQKQWHCFWQRRYAPAGQEHWQSWMT